MIDYLDDLEADFLRFYRIEDIHQLDGPRFFRLAWRVSAYGGVMHMRHERNVHHSSPVASPVVSAQPRTNHVSLTEFMLKYPGTVERTTVSLPKDGSADE